MKFSQSEIRPSVPATVSGNPFLEGIAEAYPRLTPAERKVADLLLEDPLQFSRTSMADMGASAGASAPTIMRFCRAVGCAGLTELKQGLVGSLGEYDRTVRFHLPPQRTRHGPSDVLDYSAAVVRRLRGQLDSVEVAQAVARLGAAQQVACVGAYQLGLAALYARDALLRQGIAAEAPGQPSHGQASPPGVLGLFFCHSMPDAPMIDSIKQHYHAGAGAVILSDVPLAAFIPASVKLVVGTAQAPAGGAGLMLPFCLMTDVLLAGVARKSAAG